MGIAVEPCTIDCSVREIGDCDFKVKIYMILYGRLRTIQKYTTEVSLRLLGL